MGTNLSQSTLMVSLLCCPTGNPSLMMIWYSTQLHYSDSEPTSSCPILIMLCTWLRSDKYQLYKSLVWLHHRFEPTIHRTRDPCSTDPAMALYTSGCDTKNRDLADNLISWMSWLPCSSCNIYEQFYCSLQDRTICRNLVRRLQNHMAAQAYVTWAVAPFMCMSSR